MCLCPIGGQNLSRWFRDLLIKKSSHAHANSTACRTASVENGPLKKQEITYLAACSKTKKKTKNAPTDEMGL